MRRWKWIVVALAAAVPVAGFLAWKQFDPRRANERKLAEVEAALDQSDPGWRIADILAARDAARPPADRNLTALVQDIRAARTPAWEEFSRSRNYRPTDANRLPPAEQLAAARAALTANPELVRLAHTVRQRPAGGAPLTVPPEPISIRLDHTDRARGVAEVLTVDATSAAADGDWPRALDSVADCLHLVHAVGDEPTAISQFVRIAMASVAADALERTLGLSEPPADRLAPLAAAFQAEANAPRLAWVFRGERAMTHHRFVNMDNGTLSLADYAGRTSGGLRSDYEVWAYRRRLPLDQATALEATTELLAAARLPRPEQADRIAAVEARLMKQSLILALLLTGNSRIAEADWRTAARLHATAVAVGCERFRKTHGRWPDTLSELGTPVPADPYDGKPLRLKRLPDGLVVYAVGPDRTDDGGNLGEGRGNPGEDVGFRLWDVAARRQPPLPEPAPEE